MASRTKLVFNALTSIAFYTFIVFLFLELRPFIKIYKYDIGEGYDARTREPIEIINKLSFLSFSPIDMLLEMLAWALIIGFIILFIRTSDDQTFGNEEKLEWMTYKFIPYLAYGIIGVIVTFDILRGVSHDLHFGGGRRR
jgi:hypothetical protein